MADLFHRVSIRKYQDRPVEKEKIMEILRAARQRRLQRTSSRGNSM